MSDYKLPHLAKNWITAIGAVIAIVFGVLVSVFLIASLVVGSSNQYLGILAYMVLPPILIFGLLLIPFGMYLTWRRQKKTGQIPVQEWPAIDLNNSSHRRATIIFGIGTILFVILSIIGTYEGYHFTESVTFCGRLCHTVMKPEYVTYQHSPHARVHCVECHVGPGAGWYTKSKLSGAYQVYAVLANVYPRPIPVPIKNLRPARVVCEQCHWPERFLGQQQQEFNHYEYDKENTAWPISLLLKTGGGNPDLRSIEGIHWHISSGFEVQYIASDEKRQKIPWVKMIDKSTGEETVYQDINEPLNEQEIKAATPRTMDCVDCHNRPSHIFDSPDYEVDQYINDGLIDDSIPDIKSVAVQAIAKEYETSDTALADISSSIISYYKENYPDYYSQNSGLLDTTIMKVQEIFQLNIFPAMKTRWSDYPNNIGHFYWVGCMRCHEGSHESADGKVIPHECTTCHTILSQGTQTSVTITPEGQQFKHPVNIDGAWQAIGCYECHNGEQP